MPSWRQPVKKTQTETARGEKAYWAVIRDDSARETLRVGFTMASERLSTEGKVPGAAWEGEDANLER